MYMWSSGDYIKKTFKYCNTKMIDNVTVFEFEKNQLFVQLYVYLTLCLKLY